MASGWDPEMQEPLERLEQKVDLLGVEVQQLAAEVKTVGAKVDANTERLDRVERTFASKIEIENLRDLVKRSAEGFGATLDRIERGVNEIRREVATEVGGPRSHPARSHAPDHHPGIKVAARHRETAASKHPQSSHRDTTSVHRNIATSHRNIATSNISTPTSAATRCA
jgi:archaellum component FlaC